MKISQTLSAQLTFEQRKQAEYIARARLIVERTIWRMKLFNMTHIPATFNFWICFVLLFNIEAKNIAQARKESIQHWLKRASEYCNRETFEYFHS